MKSSVAALGTLAIALATGLSHAGENTAPTFSESFALNLTCERGVGRLYVEDRVGESYVEIGVIDGAEIRSETGIDLLGRSALIEVGRTYMTDELLRSDLSNCGGGDNPTIEGVTAGGGGTAELAYICGPIENCALFDWACEKFGGVLIEYEETPLAEAHHVCVFPPADDQNQ